MPNSDLWWNMDSSKSSICEFDPFVTPHLLQWRMHLERHMSGNIRWQRWVHSIVGVALLRRLCRIPSGWYCSVGCQENIASDLCNLRKCMCLKVNRVEIEIWKEVMLFYALLRSSLPTPIMKKIWILWTTMIWLYVVVWLYVMTCMHDLLEWK